MEIREVDVPLLTRNNQSKIGTTEKPTLGY